MAKLNNISGLNKTPSSSEAYKINYIEYSGKGVAPFPTPRCSS